MSKVDKRRVRAAFSRAAPRYDEVAVLQREIAERMLERLDLFSIRPKRVLDLGAGTGHALDRLLAKYREADLYALDFAHPMLGQAKRRGRWLRRPRCLCADMDHIPLADASIDLIFSNATVQWSNDLQGTLKEFRRVLRDDGLLIFTTFGPDTLFELREAWAEVDGHRHTNQFLDMHDVGDAMLRAGFAQPVLDVDRIRLTYGAAEDLMRDLKHLGAHSVAEGRNPAITGRARLAAVKQAYERFRRDGLLPATYEVIHAHAWAGSKPATSAETLVPLEKLQRL
jgi:malonyl-CoA O-methyltransferase